MYKMLATYKNKNNLQDFCQKIKIFCIKKQIPGKLVVGVCVYVCVDMMTTETTN